jgi:trimethylamine---corrinoid protein Co-methyltransferase
MAKYSFDNQPGLRLLEEDQVRDIYKNALQVLEETGVKFEAKEALKILKDHGATVDFDSHIARISPGMVEDAVRKAPESFKLYNRDGEEAADLSGNNVHFDPASSLIKFLEPDGKTVRQTNSADLVEICRINDALENIRLQSTAVVCYDVPKLIGDSYRHYICLKNSPKAVITGAFTVDGIRHMRDMLVAISGDLDSLHEKPRAVFDICPSPPLKWTHISAMNIIDCARDGLPIELISLPMPGAATPVTLGGSLVVHTAENLSGLVLAQCVNPGNIVVYGGAPVQFDMRFGTTPFSAVEATMISAAYAQVGKYLGFPIHTYAALSDAKLVDAQAGLETGISGVIAQQAGINIISGVGGLDFVNTFSIEKMIIDHEVCGTLLRLQRGIDCSPSALVVDLIKKLGPGGNYLETEHTMQLFKTEPFSPSKVIDRRDRGSWEGEGSKNIFQRAAEKVREIRESHAPEPLDSDRAAKLDATVRTISRELGITEDLPHGP